MAEIDDLDVVDASNVARFPENQSPASLNNGSRALEGIISRWVQHTSGENLVAVTETGVNSLSVSLARGSFSNTTTASKYINGLTMLVDIPSTITGPPLLGINAHTKYAIIGAAGTSLSSSAIIAGQKVLLSFDPDALSGAGAWQMLNPPANSVSPDEIITTRGDIIRGSSAAAAERLAVGAADTFLGSDGTDPSYVAAATQAEQETGTATNKPVTPGRQHFHASAAKGWVVFDPATVDGVADLTGVAGSYNVTSLVDNGTGDHTVNWDTDFSGTGYAVFFGIQEAEGSTIADTITAKAAGSARIVCENDSQTNVDRAEVSIIAFGDQ